MKKILKILLMTSLTLLLGIVTLTGCNDMHSVTGHDYQKTTIAPTCEDRGYALYKCSCGDEYEDDFVDALGHDYTEYVMNGDGTKTRTCQRDGCEKSETKKTEKGTITFKTLENKSLNVIDVDNDVETFSFNEEVTITGDTTYNVYKSKDKKEEVDLDSTPLSVGENKFYLVFTQNDGKETVYTIKINRLKSFTVQFDLNGGTGTTPKTLTVKEGEKITQPTEIPTKVGYEFIGWDFDFTKVVKKDLVIKAEYTAKTDTPYKVEHYIPEGSGYKLQETENKQGTTDTTVVASMKNYEGLTLDADKSVKTGTVKGDGSLVIKLYYIEGYTLTFNLNGGSQNPAFNDQYIVKGKNATEPSVTPEREGYEFLIWDFDFSTSITQNVTASAIWAPKTNTPYRVEHYFENISSNGGYSIDESLTQRLTGTTDQTVVASTLEVDHFIVNSVLSTTSGNVNGSGNLVLKIYYDREVYQVTFDLNGGTRTSGGELVQTIKYGENAVAPVIFKTGHTFNGYDKVLTEISESMTIYALWKVNQYSVTFVYGNGYQNQVITKNYGESLGDVTHPEKTGYNLSFNKTVPTVMPAQHNTITAIWTKRTDVPYKVSYYLPSSSGSGHTLKETVTYQGTFEDKVSAIVKSYTGYVLDDTKGVLEGTITVTPVLNLSVYYKEVVVEQPTTWKTYSSFSSTPISTSISTKVNIGTFSVSNVNKYKLVYTLNKPVKGLITIGTHSEDFFLEAGTNVTFTSFTDDVLGDKDSLDSARSVVHTAQKANYTPGKPMEEKVTNGKTFSGTVTIYIEPIQSGTVSFKPISFGMTYQEVPDKVVYVSNSRFKVGSHLYYGGSLTYFEDLQDGRADIGNLVNIHDGGRLIQQSYYATESVSNGGVAYNPVQGGNGYGYSKLIDYTVTDNCIYVKARAKNWNDKTPLGLSSSYMENWYILEKDYVKIDNTFVDFLDSNNTDNSHESPAVYFVGGLSNIAVYTGDKPWTNDPNLRTYKAENIRLGNSGFGYTWINGGETWAAWYNDQGWGCGVYTPNTDTLRSWAAGSDDNLKTYNPYSDSTTYFTLAQSFPIRPFEKNHYSYIMATGTVQEIRNVFKENKDFADNDFPTSFADSYDLTNLDFTKEETLGFTQRYHSVNVVYDQFREVTKISAIGDDPYFGISLLGADDRPLTSDYPYIAVEYMVPERFASFYQGEVPHVYVGVGDQQYISGNQVTSFKMIADGKWHVGYVYFGDKDWYTGTINYLRYDSTVGAPYGTEYYIKSIKLLSSAPTDPAYADTYTPTAKTWMTSGRFSSNNYMCTTDAYYKSDGTFTYVGGWFLVKGGINRFEYLIAEGTLTESYVKSAQAENYWQIAYRHSTSSRTDASDSYPLIGADGSSAGYGLAIPEHLLEDGKTYQIAIRVIANNGKACLVAIKDFPAPIPEATS